MKLKFDTAGEGFVAVTTLVMYANGVASKKGFNLILKNFISQPLKILKVLDSDDLFNFFWETQYKILRKFNRNPKADEEVFLSKSEFKSLIEAAKAVLSPNIRETAFEVATELAYADGLTESEEFILKKIQTEFEINPEIATIILETVPIKYREPEPEFNESNDQLALKFDTVAEAIIAIELALAFADEDVSIKQTSNMFWNLTLLNIFKDKDPGYYYQKKHKILNMFNKQLDKPVSFNETEINTLISACKNVMDGNIRETALWVATELAYATGLNDQEKLFLDQLIEEMGIDKTVARKINQVISIKFRS